MIFPFLLALSTRTEFPALKFQMNSKSRRRLEVPWMGGAEFCTKADLI